MPSTAKIIYLGPTDKKRGLRNRAIYAGGTPAHLKEELAANPALANFFVPLARHAKVRRGHRIKAAVSASVARGPLPATSFGPPIKPR